MNASQLPAPTVPCIATSVPPPAPVVPSAPTPTLFVAHHPWDLVIAPTPPTAA